ncbi:hypothetical protein ACEZCY_15580 [Streptacidiphilus sp. N1-12]|uniref:Uncharacterized protein n=2 Tax=Streptacidiphilus alkalitolerans TaxID=3342712 RepID=A0ABV6WF27_9ACTN
MNDGSRSEPTSGATSASGILSDLDRLRAAADARIRRQIADAAKRREQQSRGRCAFAERRQHGIQRRHAAKQTRQRLAARHNPPPVEGSDTGQADSTSIHATVEVSPATPLMVKVPATGSAAET